MGKRCNLIALLHCICYDVPAAYGVQNPALFALRIRPSYLATSPPPSVSMVTSVIVNPSRGVSLCGCDLACAHRVSHIGDSLATHRRLIAHQKIIQQKFGSKIE